MRLEQLEARELLSATTTNVDAAPSLEALGVGESSAIYYSGVSRADAAIDLSNATLDASDASATLVFSNYDATTRTVTYSWDGFDPEGTGLYRVQYSSDGGATFKNLTTKTTATERLAAGISAGKTHVFRVYGLDATNANTEEYALGVFAPIAMTTNATRYEVGDELTATIRSEDAEAEFQWRRGEEAISGATSSTYVATPADAGYLLTVSATGVGNSLGSFAESSFKPSPPDAPTNLVAGEWSIATKQLELTWTAANRATEYLVYLSKDGGAYSLSATVDATSYQASMLYVGREYSFRVYAKNASGRSADYAEITYVPAAVAPAAPASASATNYDASARTLTVSWDAAETATSYLVYVSKNDGAFNLVETTENLYRTATHVKAGVKYSFRVYAKNAAGRSADYAETTFAPFTATSDKSVYDPAGDTITVSLTPGVSEATHQWYRRVNGAWIAIAGATEATYATTQEDAGLSLKDVATGVGVSAGIERELVVFSDVPVAPTAITFGVYNPKTRSVVMSWDDVDGETSYVLKSSTDGETYKVSANLDRDTTERKATMINVGTKYWFQVYSRNAAGFSVDCAEATYKPIGLSVNKEAYQPGDAIVATVAPSDADVAFQWYRADSKNSETWIPIDGATSATFAISEELAASNPWIKVVATGVEVGSDYYGAVSEIVVAPNVLEAPTFLEVDHYDASAKQIYLAWDDASENEIGFEIEYYVEATDSWIFFLAADADCELASRSASAQSVDYRYRIRAVNDDGYSEWTYSPNASTNVVVNSSVVGDDVIFSATVSGAGVSSGAGEIPSYRWFLNGVEIADATSSTLAYSDEFSGGVLTVSVRNKYGMVATDSIKLIDGVATTTNDANAIVEADYTKIACGTTITAAALFGATEAPGATYVWYADGVEIAGATGAEYATTIADRGKTITVKAYAVGGEYGGVAEADEAFLIVAPQEAPSLVVDTWEDRIDPFDGKTSLREALEIYSSVFSGDVTFSESVDWTVNTIVLSDNFAQGEVQRALRIDHTVNVIADVAQGVVVDGANRSGVFSVGGVGSISVAISGLTIRNGASGDGGGIEFFGDGGSVLSVDETSFVGNSASVGDGGAIYQDGGTLTIANSSFTGNSAAEEGGAICVDDGTLIVSGSSFTGNSAAEEGGAICVDDGTATAVNSTFVGNAVANGLGGAIYSDDAVVELQNVLIVENAARKGGGVYLSGGTTTFRNATISKNVATSGGGVYFEADSTANIYNTLIVNNTANTGREGVSDGATIHFSKVGAGSNQNGWNGSLSCELSEQGGFFDACRASILKDDYRVDVAALGGMARYVVDAGDNSQVVASMTTDLAGKKRVQKYYDAATVDLGAYEAYVWDGVVTSGVDFHVDGLVTLREGLQMVQDGRAELDRITFADYLTGTTINLTQGALEIKAEKLEIVGDVTINAANASMIFTVDESGFNRTMDVKLTDLTLANGGGEYYGVYLPAVLVRCEGSVFECDSATFVNCGTESKGNGGAVLIEKGKTATFTNTTFDNCVARNGGGIAVTTSSSADVVVADCLFDGCKASNNGGALYMANSGPGMTVSNVAFTNNTSGNNGAVLYAQNLANGKAIAFVDVVATGNAASNNGGVFYANGATTRVAVSGGAYYKNAATNNGGVFASNMGTIDANGCVMIDNSATNGGALYIRQAQSSSATIENAIIAKNVALCSGGALDVYDSKATLTDVAIVGNSGRYGGGLCVNGANGDETALNNVILYGNTSTLNANQNEVYRIGSNAKITANYVLSYYNAWRRVGGNFANSISNPIEMNDDDSLAAVLDACSDPTVANSYALTAGSPAEGAGPNGKDVGAQFSLSAAQARAMSAALDDAFAELFIEGFDEF